MRLTHFVALIQEVTGVTIFSTPTSAEDVEKCKQKDLLAEMLAEMTGDFPTLYKVFVTERDQFLARALRLSAVPVHLHGPNGGESNVCLNEPK